MPLSPGQRLGAYEIVAPIGGGGMGEVYRARDIRLQRMVAVKIVRAAVAGDADALARFEREARAVAALSPINDQLAAVADGSRFLIRRDIGDANLAPVNVVLNWRELLK